MCAQARIAVPVRTRWGVVRAFASLHLLAMLSIYVVRHPGAPPQLVPPAAARGVLEQLGLWDPSVGSSMLPVAAVLFLVRPRGPKPYTIPSTTLS